MQKALRRALCIAAAGALASLTGVAPAAAQGLAGGSVVGSGVISPGLTATFQPQTISMTGTLEGAAYANGPQLYLGTSCTFNGGSSGMGENLAFGEGWLSGTCGNITTTFTYVRVGAIVAQLGSGSVNGIPSSHIGICIWIPTSGPTATTFLHVGIWVWIAP